MILLWYTLKMGWFNRLLLNIIAGISAVFSADKLIQGVNLNIIPGKSVFFGFEFVSYWQILILVGAVLGLINSFLKPILKLITFPLRIITLGLFSFVINLFLIWLLDILFLELEIKGLLALLWTTLIVFILSFILGLYRKQKPKKITNGEN
jgi:putative membrane protein